MKNKVVVALLVASMVVTPVQNIRSVSAAEVSTHANTTESVHRGTCGENVKWELRDGTLTLTGSGAIDDFDDWNGVYASWHDYASEIKALVIEEGITSIGVSAFSGCEFLTDITFPDSITSIGDRAFNCCMGLTEIVLPDNITSISSGTFHGCQALRKVTIPEGVTRIGEHAFEDCAEIKEIDFPNSITHIDECAFSNCGFVQITIPDTVTTISDGAFNSCFTLQKVTIPDTVTSIGAGAFSNCPKLTDVYFMGDAPEKVSKLGEKDGEYESDISSFPEGVTLRYKKSASGWTSPTWKGYKTRPVESGSWKKNRTGWWYRHEDGSYRKNAWEKISGKWYHFDNRGYMQTGWLKTGGRWYYLSGSGAMQTGWKRINRKWYHMNSSGKMHANCWLRSGNNWYHLDKSGAMQTGWKWINGKCYYFSKSGRMAKSTVINGWKVGKDGAWMK